MGLLFANPYSPEARAIPLGSIPLNYWQQQNMPVSPQLPVAAAGQPAGAAPAGTAGGMGSGGMNLQMLFQILRPFIMQAMQQRRQMGGGLRPGPDGMGLPVPMAGAMGGQLPPPRVQQAYPPGRSPQDIEAASRYMAANPGQFGGLDLGGMDPNTLYQRAHFMQSNPGLFENRGGQMTQVVAQPLGQLPVGQFQGAPGMPGQAGGTMAPANLGSA